MTTFFQFLGAAVVGLLIVICGLYFWIRWKFRSWVKSFANAFEIPSPQVIPPFRIKLEDYRYHFSDDKQLTEEYQQLREQIQAEGFEEIGLYWVPEIITVVCAYHSADHTVWGIAYQQPHLGTFFDLVRLYENGNSITYSNIEDPLVDNPPWINKTFLSDHDFNSALNQFLSDVPEEEAVRLFNEGFVESFSKVYAREMDWRIERDGMTEAEIRRIVTRDGEECTDQTIKQIQSNWHHAISDFFAQRLLNSYRKQENLKPLEWLPLRSEGIVIHERMKAPQLLEVLHQEYHPEMNLEDLDPDDSEEVAEFQHFQKLLTEMEYSLQTKTPMEVFRDQNLALKLEDQFCFLGSVQTPIAGEIWISINYEEEDDTDWQNDSTVFID